MGSRFMGSDSLLTIIDYKMGNVRSVVKTFELLGIDTTVSYDEREIRKASHLVLPGVGAFADGMRNLQDLGLVDLLHEEVVIGKKPILGICLGMQLMAKDSEEFEKCKGLGWVDANVKSFDLADKNLKVPHVGWNNIQIKGEPPLFENVKDGWDFYFVHSYHVVCNDQGIVTATADYGGEFTASFQMDNIFATQFHPEKSQVYGLKILKNFLAYN